MTLDETRKHFGNSVLLFTPLYVSNHCSNKCVCGFNRRNKILKVTLNFDSVEKELDAIVAMRLREVLIFAGESRGRSGVDYTRST